MSAPRVLITGGAGFVGSTLCVSLATRHPEWEIVALDNLKRRGSELTLGRLKAADVRFVHGDVREPADLAALEPLDAVVECSAEPSALSGVDGATEYVVRSNLIGAWHCLELARRARAQLVFLSTSRVYPVAALNRVRYSEGETRFELNPDQQLPGVSPHGIAEDFPLAGARTLYGSTKLAGELLIEEYRELFGLQAVVNRCGVIAGPWQMGKVDQGVFTHWLLAHLFDRPLRYIGYGGKGKQVRDLLHVEDLADLVDQQLLDPAQWDGAVLNVGGGSGCSLSLLETTALCRELTGRELDILVEPQGRPGDVPIYISDCRALRSRSSWRPRRGPREIIGDILAWAGEHENQLKRALELK